MRPSRATFLSLTVFVILFGAGHANAVAEVNHWNGFASTTFTQGFARTSCPGQAPCQDDDFNLSDNSEADCGWTGTEPSGPYGCIARVVSELSWDLDGLAGHLPEPGGDAIILTTATVHGERIDADLFVVNVVTTNSYVPGPVQVAVFQYSGDPTVFDGLEVDSIQDLVDLGIISSDDILAIETIIDDGSHEFQVQVTGLADDEIVLFATGDGRIPPAVPATNSVGTGVLLLVMFGLGTLWALRRRSANAD